MSARRVLVVDDDAALVDFIRMVLEDGDYQVLTAQGSDAVQVAREGHPNVILLDVMMPHADGIAVSESLRADPLTAQIPIVLMSASERLASVPRHLRINDQLAKPFHFGDLYATVARWVPSA